MTMSLERFTMRLRDLGRIILRAMVLVLVKTLYMTCLSEGAPEMSVGKRPESPCTQSRTDPDGTGHSPSPDIPIEGGVHIRQ